MLETLHIVVLVVGIVGVVVFAVAWCVAPPDECVLVEVG